jgi:hypothetical protein
MATSYIVKLRPDKAELQYKVQLSVAEDRLGQKSLIMWDFVSDKAEIVVQGRPFRESMEAGVSAKEYVRDFVDKIRLFLLSLVPGSDINVYVDAIIGEMLVEVPKMLDEIKDEVKIVRHWPV